MKLAVVGVTGPVGQEILKVMKSETSSSITCCPWLGQETLVKQIEYKGKKYTIEEAVKVEEVFSAGGGVSPEGKQLTVPNIVIDNPSVWEWIPMETEPPEQLWAELTIVTLPTPQCANHLTSDDCTRCSG